MMKSGEKRVLKQEAKSEEKNWTQKLIESIKFIVIFFLFFFFCVNNLQYKRVGKFQVEYKVAKSRESETLNWIK